MICLSEPENVMNGPGGGVGAVQLKISEKTRIISEQMSSQNLV